MPDGSSEEKQAPIERVGAGRMERWERRERKLFKRRDGMRVTGIGLKKVVLPVIRKKAEEAAKAESERKARVTEKG